MIAGAARVIVIPCQQTGSTWRGFVANDHGGTGSAEHRRGSCIVALWIGNGKGHRFPTFQTTILNGIDVNLRGVFARKKLHLIGGGKTTVIGARVGGSGITQSDPRIKQTARATDLESAAGRPVFGGERRAGDDGNLVGLSKLTLQHVKQITLTVAIQVARGRIIGVHPEFFGHPVRNTIAIAVHVFRFEAVELAGTARLGHLQELVVDVHGGHVGRPRFRAQQGLNGRERSVGSIVTDDAVAFARFRIEEDRNFGGCDQGVADFEAIPSREGIGARFGLKPVAATIVVGIPIRIEPPGIVELLPNVIESVRRVAARHRLLTYRPCVKIDLDTGLSRGRRQAGKET